MDLAQVRRKVDELTRAAFLFDNPHEAAQVHGSTPSKRSYGARLDREIKALQTAKPNARYIPLAEGPLNALLARRGIEKTVEALTEDLDRQKALLQEIRGQNVQDEEFLQELQIIQEGLRKRLDEEGKKHGEENIVESLQARDGATVKDLDYLMKALILFIDEWLAPYLASESTGRPPHTLHNTSSRRKTQEVNYMKQLLEDLMNGLVLGDPWVEAEDRAGANMLIRAGVAFYRPGDSRQMRLVDFHRRF